MSTIRFTKQELLDHLDKQVIVAEKHDAKVLKKHEADEAKYLKRFRAACQKAIEWDYEEGKKRSWSPTNLLGKNWQDTRPPQCPRSIANSIKRVRRYVDISQQQTYTLSDSRKSRHSDIYDLVVWTPEPAPKMDVC